MHFALIDTILERTPQRVRAIKQVTLAEEYLQDHFPTFHVLPGVFMLEALVQSARALLEAQGHPRMVLGGVRAMRYGTFVRPGDALEVEVTLEKTQPDGTFVFKGVGTVRRFAAPAAGAGGLDGPGGAPATPATPPEPETAVSGRFTMRPLRVPALTPAPAPAATAAMETPVG